MMRIPRHIRRHDTPLSEAFSACFNDANTDTGLFHSSAVLLNPVRFAPSFFASSPSFSLSLPLSPPRSISPKLLPAPLAAAEPKGLEPPLNALKALVAEGVVVGVFGGVLSAGFPNGEDVERLDFPKNEVDGAEPKAEEAPKDGVPNEGAPNAGVPATSDLLVGVVVPLPNDVCPKTDVVGVVVLGFWKKGEEVDVVPPNAPKPGCSLLNPVEDVVNPPNAPPVEGRGAAGVVVRLPNAPPEAAGVAVGVVVDFVGAGVLVAVSADLAGGVAGGVETAGVGFSGVAKAVVDTGAADVDAGVDELLASNALVLPKGLVDCVGVAPPNGVGAGAPNAGFDCSLLLD